MSIRIGVISDTHGLLRPEAMALLQGVDHILHGGDVGPESILEELERIAPVTAVRGNVDTAPGCREKLPSDNVLEVGGFHLYMRHILDDLDLDPQAAGFAAVIYGHSHQPAIDWRDGVLYFNPGSAGPRRFRLPISLGCLQISEGVITPELIDLPDGVQGPPQRP